MRICLPSSVIRALVIFDFTTAIISYGLVCALIDELFQSRTICLSTNRGDTFLHFSGGRETKSRVSRFVLDKVREVTRPLLFHLREHVRWRRPARQRRRDFC